MTVQVALYNQFQMQAEAPVFAFVEAQSTASSVVSVCYFLADRLRAPSTSFGLNREQGLSAARVYVSSVGDRYGRKSGHEAIVWRKMESKREESAHDSLSMSVRRVLCGNRYVG
jgi:hypothetical protein